MKLLLTNGDTLLFDLSKDMEERDNIAMENMDLLGSMLAALEDWEKEINTYVQKTK